MKYVVLFAVLLVVYLVWRGQRAAERREAAAEQAPRPPAQIPQLEMVRCPVCGLHLPRTDALPGRSGRLYCCAEHRASGDN